MEKVEIFEYPGEIIVQPIIVTYYNAILDNSFFDCHRIDASSILKYPCG